MACTKLLNKGIFLHAFPQYYDFCDKWNEEEVDGPNAYAERDAFIASPDFADSLSRVQERLGFEQELTFEDMDIMWDMCRFDRSRRPDLLPAWCGALPEEDLRVMEYVDDLVNYYQDMYGNDINREMPCPLIQDMAAAFK